MKWFNDKFYKYMDFILSAEQFLKCISLRVGHIKINIIFESLLNTMKKPLLFETDYLDLETNQDCKQTLKL